MRRRLLIVVVALATAFVMAVPAVGAPSKKKAPDPIPVEITDQLKNRQAPAQPNTAESHATVEGPPTAGAQCDGDEDAYLEIVIPSFDAAHPGNPTVTFWKETVSTSTGTATLWVAWDFLEDHFGEQDIITCEQLAYLQSSMDAIVATNVHYFGEYVERPAGNSNIDVMIYDIVDESSFDPTFPSYIAGFFWGSLNEAFDRNMIFIDSYDWENRLGPDAARPFLYEGTVAHELEHLIHNDHDPDEVSWVDEGMADLAEYLNGFGHPDGHVVYYLAFHRTPLTVWGGGLEDYGASYLFQLYLLENFGSMTGEVWDNDWTMDLIDEQANSIAGIEAATGADFNDLFDSWILANFVDDTGNTGPGGFPIGYDEIDLTPFESGAFSPWSIERSIKDIYGAGHKGNLPIPRIAGGGYVSGQVEFPVGQLPPYTPLYGAYKGVPPVLNIFLQGASQSGVAPNGGDYEMASGGGNLVSDRMLAFASPILSDGTTTLGFSTWYDIEEEWDYGFVEASTDGGATWTPLVGSITTYSENPFGSTAWANSLLGADASSDAVITGMSGGWIGDAEFVLPAGSVDVRFSYYTDEAFNGAGWFIDDVAIDGVPFDGFEDGPTSAGNWDFGGWERTTGLFENDWIAAYIAPVYAKGKYSGYQYGYIDTGVMCDDSECLQGSVDTSQLNKGEATVVFANRPGENPFPTDYLLLVDKGNARS